MNKKKSKLKLAQAAAEASISKTNEKITDLGKHTNKLYENLTVIQKKFDDIRNIPSDEFLEYEKLKKIRLNWRQQAEKIESDYRDATVKNAGAGAAGVGTGVAVAAIGPTAAMGIATTFGVASTGTAISTLSGAAATNAALAWLGGGALATGGGGIAAGDAFLALAGPLGWAIAGAALIGSGILLLKSKSDNNRIEDIFMLISKRDVKSYDLAIVELNERISRIDEETPRLEEAIEKISTFGLDYEKMTEAQQYKLGAYVNLMNSSTQLLVNPIMGLKPKYSDEDFEKYEAARIISLSDEKKRSMIVSLSNLLYRIKLDDTDRKLLWKSFRGNKNFLTTMEMAKNDFVFSIFEAIDDALKYKYSLESVNA